MILVDTSVWIEHLRKGVPELVRLLQSSQVLMHPFVRGELACGNLSNRNELLRLLAALPVAREATHGEVMFYIENRKLMGKGIGFVDAHLLTATSLTDQTTLWTYDKNLARLATRLGIAHE